MQNRDANKVSIMAVSIKNAIDMFYLFGRAPYITVVVEAPSVRIPQYAHSELTIPFHLVKNNRIVFNLDAGAIRDLFINVEEAILVFNARFSGNAMQVVIPMEHIATVHDRERTLELDQVVNWKFIPNPFSNKALVNPPAVEKPPKRSNPFKLVEK